jgi:hypothetical protein
LSMNHSEVVVSSGREWGGDEGVGEG